MELAVRMLHKLGLTAYLKERLLIPKFLNPRLYRRAMRFPTFGSELHHSVRLDEDYLGLPRWD